MDWQPIESYDALAANKRPKLAVFVFAERPAYRIGGVGLQQMLRLERYAGNREATHWMPLPEPPK